jgi:4-amino-4-deoxy-L-arabinose transferase-like glycosyltransferase
LAVAMVLIVAGHSSRWLVCDERLLRLFFVDEHLGRATTTFENHGGGLWFYPLAVAAGFFPWSIFLVPMFLGIDRRLSKPHPMSTALVFLLCWVGVQIGIFSLVSTKLPSYVTPCFPALALCCGYYLERL